MKTRELKQKAKTLIVLVVLITFLTTFSGINLVGNTYKTGNEPNQLISLTSKWRELNILCVVITYPENLEKRTKFVNETWTRQCNKTIFVSDEHNGEFPTIKVTDQKGKSELWAKSRNAIELLYYKYLNKFDWFFKAEDDTYVVMDNLRKFLYFKDSSKLEWYGKAMINGSDNSIYPHGGAGYAFGSKALKQLVEVGFKNGPNCPKDSVSSPNYDVYLGSCLTNSGIELIKDCFDSHGRELFHPLSFQDEFALAWDKSNYFYKNSLNKVATEKCCSSESVSFHKVIGREQLFMDYFIREFKPPDKKSQR
ncbi:glycoprotein-N-acetylgalactosamine 3-beta-galactosyltransferase 1-like [Convolutriloba macropyga]|uniref:glycoprotein-N-acetylgalactosamine 3-beta-galactosyltransferase 1-like n=1 Tax=Convolutriloba macropyga TaxID=536237 RepID=UPI003F51C405